MLIDASIRMLVDAFQKSGQSMGQMEYSATELHESLAPNVLTGELLYFYQHTVLLDKPTFGGDFFIQLIEAPNLLNMLSGWRAPGKSDWPDNYIIFGDRNGDALFCDISDEKSPVYGSVQKNNFHLSDSLADFFTLYVRLVELEETEFGCDTKNEDFSYKNEYLDAVDAELKKYTSPDFASHFMYFFLG